MKKKTKESRFFIEREFSCSTDACHVVTKISVPKSFDCAKPFICGFCAFHQQKQPRSFSIVFLDNLTKESKERSCIAREIRQEQNEQKIKKLNLFIKGTVPSRSTNDKEYVQKLAQTINIVLDIADMETTRIGKISEQNRNLFFLSNSNLK